jgi:hypothetical protein
MQEMLKKVAVKLSGDEELRNDVFLVIFGLLLFPLFIYGPLKEGAFTNILKFDLLLIAGAAVAKKGVNAVENIKKK